MKATVVIPTFNGRNRIGNILEALTHQVVKEFQVIVIVDGSTDGTSEYLLETSFDLDLKVMTQKNTGRAIVRNSGAVGAKEGDFLLFLDDDMRPEPDCIQAHLVHHEKIEDSILVGAQLEEHALMKRDFQRFKATLSKKWSAGIKTDGRGRQMGRPFITAAHFSIPKRLFDSLGGFDERLTDAEDYELAVRCERQDIPVYYNPQIIAWHDDFTSARKYTRRLRQYYKAHAKLQTILPETPPLVEIPVQKNPFKKLANTILGHSFFLTLIDQTKLLLVLPRPVRFKFYDLVVTSLALRYPQRPI